MTRRLKRLFGMARGVCVSRNLTENNFFVIEMFPLTIDQQSETHLVGSDSLRRHSRFYTSRSELDHRLSRRRRCKYQFSPAAAVRAVSVDEWDGSVGGEAS
jgi:predicted nuclease with RNAse H fold